MSKSKKNWVTVQLNLDKDLLLALAIEAHNRDMKLNDLIVEILERIVKDGSKE